jgi:hypothetical protein
MTLIHRHRKVWGTLGLLLALVAAMLAVLLAQVRSPLTYSSARERWERQAPQHYELEVEAQAEGVAMHLLLEVRDEQLVRGINLRTGALLTADHLAPYRTWLPIDRLFDLIELRSYGGNTWRHRVAALTPGVAQQLQWCLARPMRVGYDPQLGYPATVRFRENVCSPNEPLEVHLGVTPLPN